MEFKIIFYKDQRSQRDKATRKPEDLEGRGVQYARRRGMSTSAVRGDRGSCKNAKRRRGKGSYPLPRGKGLHLSKILNLIPILVLFILSIENNKYTHDGKGVSYLTSVVGSCTKTLVAFDQNEYFTKSLINDILSNLLHFYRFTTLT